MLTFVRSMVVDMILLFLYLSVMDVCKLGSELRKAFLTRQCIVKVSVRILEQVVFLIIVVFHSLLPTSLLHLTTVVPCAHRVNNIGMYASDCANDQTGLESIPKSTLHSRAIPILKVCCG